LTKQNVKNYWGEHLENLPRALQNIHSHRGSSKSKSGQKTRSQQISKKFFG
jgi:hypothetical protein